MTIVGIIVYVLGVLLVLTWVFGTRNKVRTGDGFQVQTLVTLFFAVVSLVLVPILKWSPLHLLWMFPASFICGFLSILFPFSVLQPFGNLTGMIACVGLDQVEVANNKRRRQRLVELVTQENLSVDDAKKKMEENGEW